MDAGARIADIEGMDISPAEWLAVAATALLASVGLALVVALSFCF